MADDTHAGTSADDGAHDGPQESGADPQTLVVGIGASAGGLAAAEAFFRGLPPHPGMAFVVVQHLAPDHESEMAELLQNHTSLYVSQAEDRQEVRPDHVYTIPPGRQLTIEDGRLRVTPSGGRGGHVQAPIDGFFRSLAEELGEAAACVILSGTGTDGTVGLKAIKEAGGVTLVQSPSDAEYDGMPRSAVGTGLADITGTARELAERLVEFRRSASEITFPEASALPEDENAALSRIFSQLRARTGHDFSHYKRSSILRRVSRRLQVLGTPDISSYLTYVRENPDELYALFKDFLISVTNFFRDAEAWQTLETEVIPQIFEGKGPRDTVRAWVPGCATGEEAFSVAMLLSEHASRMEPPPELQVFATDIDEDALTFAREALYPEAIASDLSDVRRRQFFTEEQGGLRVAKQVREIVLFAPHNLLRDAPFSRQDLVTCRNLLIYLNREVQETAFELFHYALRNDGFLFLGSSESAESAGRLFAPVEKRHRIYRRQSTPARVPTLPTIAAADLPDRGRFGRRDEPQDRTLAERHRDHLLDRRVPPTLLVDSDYQVCHSAGGAHRFLREVDGMPNRSLMEKILPELRLDVRAALYQALQTGDSVETRSTRIEVDGEPRDVRMEVVALDERAFAGRFAEIVFRLEEPVEPADAAPRAPVDEEVASRLESELDRTRERLQTVIEEYETANEELKASNEELQSMNEELRSTSEELETGKEELQSMNEELVTVNQELRNKIQELARANSDLNNLMSATQIGTIFLDRELRIKRYTSPAEELYHLQPGDIGRPLRALTQRLTPHDLVETAGQVLRDLTPMQVEQRSEDGRWFITRIRPYRTVDDLIEGVVLTFLDVSELKRAEQRAHFQANVLAQISDGVIAVDDDGRIIYLNAAAADRFEIDAASARGKVLNDVVEIRYPDGSSRDAAQAALREHGEWRGEATYVTRSGRHLDIEARISSLEDEDGQTVGALGVLRDITDRKAAEALAHERQQYLKTALRNVPIVAAIVDTDLRYRWIYNPHDDFDTEQIIGKRDDELLGEDEATAIMQLKREVLHHGRGIRRELTFERSDGSYIYDMTVDPLLDDEGRLVGLTTAGLEITDRKRNEEELERARKDAEAANASKSAFLAAMSHELRTPLNAITGYVDLMELGVPDPLSRAQADQVERIRVSASHLLQLIEEILQFARVDAGQEEVHHEDVVLRDIVEEIRVIMEPLALQKELELRIDAEDAPNTVHTDARKLRQALLNLMGNAVKFTQNGRVELRIESENGELNLHVIDTGPGMTPEEIPNIFEPFWQSDSSLTRKAGGTGLGLAISKRYIELLGGDIRVRSAPGSGSAFTISVPMDGDDD